MNTKHEHFHRDEWEFVDKVEEWKKEVIIYYTPVLTPFLDLREQQIVASIMGKSDEYNVTFFGGFQNSERKRAYMYPSYLEETEDDFNIQAMQFTFRSQFQTVEHRHVLGSLMQLGVKREKFGDIVIENETVSFVCDRSIVMYLRMNLEKVGRTTVSLKEVSLTELPMISDEWEERTGTVSSLRLDSVLSEIYRLSRSKTQPLIEAGRVKVNHRLTEQPSHICEEGSIFSVRGHGRAKLIRVEGITRKENYRILFGIQK